MRDEKRRLDMKEKQTKKRSLDYIVNKIASYFEIILKDYNKYLNKIEINNECKDKSNKLWLS